MATLKQDDFAASEVDLSLYCSFKARANWSVIGFVR